MDSGCLDEEAAVVQDELHSAVHSEHENVAQQLGTQTGVFGQSKEAV